MTARELCTVALRVLGVYFIVRGAVSVNNAIAFLFAVIVALFESTPDIDRSASVSMMILISSAFPFVVLVAAGLLLLFRAHRITSAWPEGRDGTSSPVAGVTSREAQSIAFAVVGVFAIVTAVPGLCSAVGQVWYWTHSDSGFPEHRASWARSSLLTLIGHSAQLLVGVVLFFGARQLARWWHALRAAGKTTNA